MKEGLIILLLTATIILEVAACSCSDYLLDLPIKEMGWTQSKSENISNLSDLEMENSKENGKSRIEEVGLLKKVSTKMVKR